jgi:hypothetical protein
MRWTATAHGYAAERAVDPNVVRDGSICRIRDAAMLSRGRVEPALEAWLDRIGVLRVAATATSVVTHRDGTALIDSGEQQSSAASLVLADDEAILALQASSDRHRLTVPVAATAVLTEPARNALPSPVCHYLDRDLVLCQRAARDGVSGLVGGEPETALARMGASTAGLGPLRGIGRAAFRAIETLDGAPLVGRFGRHKVAIVAGMGQHAAFVAPALSRMLAGAADHADLGYFEARDVSRAAHRQAVAERQPAAGEAAA